MSTLRRLITLAPTHSVARRAASLVILLVAASPALLFVFVFAIMRPGWFLVLCGFAIAGLWTVRWLIDEYNLHDRAQRATAEHNALQDHLRALGLDPDASDDPRAEVARRAFWSERQRQAITELQRRAAQHNPYRDPLGMVWHAPRLLRYGLSVVCLCLLAYAALLARVTSIVGSFDGPPVPFHITMFYCTGFTLLLCCYPLAFYGIVEWLQSGAQQLELKREVRRVEELADLAGGLTLAGEEVEALLRGALSSDAAQAGEIEEVQP